ncbi:GNAT family N-acetyltransferase [Paractinoplanes ferrugineus]|uniref:N-acetyltransferase n=1 Tax=Paractinoplanes ferrugineus TaxID=113564 RepID=A0A919MCM4_9ACTN|nr:GNAT family N-acetyltransferase [Actinoplanes ferrugineus]GIE09634.1 N-acetyltransferase [Actinoplanes ferrugineus]
MGVEFLVDPELDDDLKARIVALWVEVTNAGGAVGFVAPITAAEVWETAEAAFGGVTSGLDRLIVGVEDGALGALLFVVDNRFGLKDHWRVLKRVMVSPERQGRGLGAALMREAEALARAMGLAALHVTVRGGTGREDFYARLGYREVGRIPGAIRVAPGDDRDDILMWLELGAGTPKAAGLTTPG